MEGLGFTDPLGRPAVFDIFELPDWLEAALDCDEPVLLVKPASADVSRESIEPQVTRGPRLRQCQQRRPDALAMQTHLHMQLGHRLLGGCDEPYEPRFENCQRDSMRRKNMSEKVFALLGQRMRIAYSNTELEGFSPKRDQMLKV